VSQYCWVFFSISWNGYCCCMTALALEFWIPGLYLEGAGHAFGLMPSILMQTSQHVKFWRRVISTLKSEVSAFNPALIEYFQNFRQAVETPGSIRARRQKFQRHLEQAAAG